jgi:hypothetical protein
VFLAPAAMRKYFGEYERWMLARGDAKEAPAERASFRDLLKNEVEKLAAALREGKPFEPYRFDAQAEEAECNTSSVTI